MPPLEVIEARGVLYETKKQSAGGKHLLYIVKQKRTEEGSVGTQPAKGVFSRGS